MAHEFRIPGLILAASLMGCHEPAPGGFRESPDVIHVRTIRPRRGPDLAVSVEQPAFVAPYFRVELNAAAPGTVTFIEKDIGDRVTAGERVVEVVGTDKTVMPLKAPFDGVVSARGADPGAFAQDAAVVPGAMALMTIERTDIVTISMAVPEPYIAQVTPETEAEIRMDALPGTVIRAKVTRMAPSLRASDRTLRVEVDLFNGTEDEHRKLAARAKAGNPDMLKGGLVPSFPVLPKGAAAARLLPGMYGTMRLVLKSFHDTDLVPSTVVFRKGGVPSVFVVKDGVARLVPVVVDFDNGVMAKIRIAPGAGGPPGFTASDELVSSQQGELSDGQAVLPHLANW